MDRHDYLAALGLLLMTTGLWLYSPALALVVLGLALLGLGLYGAMRQ